MYFRVVIYMKLLGVLFFLVTMSGCAGVIVSSPSTTNYKNPTLSHYLENTDSDHTRTVEHSDEAVSYDMNQVKKYWGEPSNSKHNSEYDIWLYKHPNEWCGVVPFLVIPIPLVLPVCEHSYEVKFKNNLVESIKEKYPTVWGGICGPLLDGMGSPTGNSHFCK